MVNALSSFPMKHCSYYVGLLFAPLTKKLHLYLSLMHHNIISLTGAKSITKAMKKVASGPQRDEGTKWFSELSDKGLLRTVLFVLFLSYDIINFLIYCY